MDIENFLASHPYAATTKRTYSNVLQQFVTECQNQATLTAADLLQFINKSEWGNSRQRVALAACQKFLKWKYGHQHPALTAKVKRTQSKPQRSLTERQALELLASFDRHSPKGARDLAICAVAIDTGLRAAELCRLQQADTDTQKCTLQVIVKGGQWAAAVFTPETAAHIEHWKRFRTIADGHGHLFTNIHNSQPLTPEGLYNIIEAWGNNIGIKLSPHDLRRSFAVIATEMGAPERTLMEGGRWSTSDMIKQYTRNLKLESMRKYLPMRRLQGDEKV